MLVLLEDQQNLLRGTQIGDSWVTCIGKLAGFKYLASIFYDGTMKTEADGTRILYDLSSKDGRANTTLLDGQMLDFDGSADYVDIPSVYTTTPSALTFKLSIQGSNSYQTLIDRNSYRQLIIYEGELTYLQSSAATDRYVKMFAIAEGEHYDIHVTIVNGKLDCYMNGSHVFTQNDILINGSLVGDMTVGATKARSQFYQGNIGNVQFWNTAFTPQQVVYDYNNPEKALYMLNGNLASNNTGIDVADCASWYPLTEGQGSYVRDMVSYGEEEILKSLSLSDFNGSNCTGSQVGDIVTFTIDTDAGAYCYFNLNTGTLTEALVDGNRYRAFINANFSDSGFMRWYNQIQDVETTGYKEWDVIVTQNGGIYIRFDFVNDTTGDTVDVDVSKLSIQKLSGTTQIPHIDPQLAWDNGQGGSTALQMSGLQRDSLGKLIGLADGYTLHGQTPALPLDMTDTELYASGEFSVGFVIEREFNTTEHTRLLYTYTSSTGMQIITGLSYTPDRIHLQIYDGSSSVICANSIDENKHHIVFTVSPTHLTMYVDGVAGTPVAHAFAPSGLNFKDSAQVGPEGSMLAFQTYFHALTQEEVNSEYDKLILDGAFGDLLTSNGNYITTNGDYIIIGD